MEKILLKSCIYKFKNKDHIKIKYKVLEEISKDINSKELCIKDGYIDDKISKLDWHISTVTDRPWVVEFYPSFSKIIDEFVSNTPYNYVDLNNLWYQQYKLHDRHGWHIHGNQFTGVYYLEFPKGSSQTMLLNSFDNSKTFIDADEGDMIIFPSHIVHSGPINGSERKTIISFNFSLGVNEKDDAVDFEFMETV